MNSYLKSSSKTEGQLEQGVKMLLPSHSPASSVYKETHSSSSLSYSDHQATHLPLLQNKDWGLYYEVMFYQGNHNDAGGSVMSYETVHHEGLSVLIFHYGSTGHFP
jgi:hypothetical protein